LNRLFQSLALKPKHANYILEPPENEQQKLSYQSNINFGFSGDFCSVHNNYKFKIANHQPYSSPNSYHRGRNRISMVQKNKQLADTLNAT